MTELKVRHARSRPAPSTIYRNYFVPVAGDVGQTSTRRIDGLAGIGEALSRALGRSVETLWQMRNGYALCHQTGLESISAHLTKLGSRRSGCAAGKTADRRADRRRGDRRAGRAEAACFSRRSVRPCL